MKNRNRSREGRELSHKAHKDHKVSDLRVCSTVGNGFFWFVLA